MNLCNLWIFSSRPFGPTSYPRSPREIKRVISRGKSAVISLGVFLTGILTGHPKNYLAMRKDRPA